MATTKCGFDDGPGLLGRDALVVYGPTLFVRIGFDPTYDPAKGAIPNIPTDQHNALVDTGATQSCIDISLATLLKLPIYDRKTLSGALGAGPVNMYLGQIHIPTLNHIIYGGFAGVALVSGGQPHRALIGRDFLKSFTMTYEGTTGTVTLSS